MKATGRLKVGLPIGWLSEAQLTPCDPHPALSLIRFGLAEVFRAYCKSVAEEAVWGGEHELVSLAAILGRSLVVHQSGSAPTHFDPPSGLVKDKAPLQLSYHRHQYSLGNHYNSLRDVQAGELVSAEA